MLDSHCTFSRISWRAVFLLAIALAAAPAGADDAADFCGDVERLVRESRSNFADWATAASGEAPHLKLSGAESCVLTRSLSGARTYYCTWAFPYRSVEAYGSFDATKASLQDCFGEQTPSRRDQRVNHPDFYDLQQFELGDVAVTVSIKDKSAQQKTYLFLRVQGATPD